MSEVPPPTSTDAEVDPEPVATTEDLVGSEVGPVEPSEALNVDGETIVSCGSLAPNAPVTSEETPFTIRSGLTSSGGTWISIDDSMNRRLASVVQLDRPVFDAATSEPGHHRKDQPRGRNTGCA